MNEGFQDRVAFISRTVDAPSFNLVGWSTCPDIGDFEGSILAALGMPNG